MTDAELQDLADRIKRLERSAWRWRWFASVLAVLFLLLLSLGLVSFVAVRNEAMMHSRTILVEDLEAAERARAEADEQRRAAEAEARRRAARGAKGQAEEARPQRPPGDNSQGP